MGPNFIIAEFLPIINSCHFHISVENAQNVSDIIVRRSDISLQFKGTSTESTFQYNLANGIHLKPDSKTGVDIKSSWISFRVQLEEKTRIVNSVLNEIQKILPNQYKSTKNVETSLNPFINNIFVSCKHCQTALSNSLNFDKVLVQPSVNWDGSSESWFCHAHEAELKPFKKQNLVPKETECFYDAMGFYLKDSHMMKSIGDKIMCPKCDANVGFVKENVIMLMSSDIQWMHESSIVYSIDNSDIYFNLLDSINKDSLEASPKLVFFTDSSPKKFLYILAIDCYLTLMTTDETKLLASGEPMLNDSSHKRKINTDTFCKNLNKVNAVKVMYEVKMEPDDETGMWEDDINIHIIQCTETFFESIYKQLDHTNELLPPTARSTANMNIGYVVQKA